MSITITDPMLLTAFAKANGPVRVQDAEGRTLGTFTGGSDGQLPPGVKSPFSEEEMARRRADQRSGRTLQEIMKDLKARG